MVSMMLKVRAEGYHMKVKAWILSIVFALACTTVVRGVPDLQLDVSGGVYNWADETVYNSTDPFTLYALAKTASTEGTSYYISIAIVPKTSDTALPGFGSFSFGGTTYDASSGWLFGVPPVDALIGDIPTHGLYPTLFLEVSFDKLDGFAEEYNSQDTPGGFSLYDGSGPSLGYKAFEVNTTSLGINYALHFDFYTYSEPGKVDAFAPFSHDAQTTRVPEGGATVALLGAALAGIGILRRYLKV